MPQLTKPGEQHKQAAPPIEAVQLSAAYNGEIALKDINFCLDPGSRVAVVGPNGAGKTTLFKVISPASWRQVTVDSMCTVISRGSICVLLICRSAPR